MKKNKNEQDHTVVSRNDMVKITIAFKEGQHEMEVGFKKIETTWVDGASLLEQYRNGCLVEKNHKFLQTQYILSGAKSSLLLEFDDKQQFVSLKTYFNITDAPISYLVSSSYVLLIPASSKLSLNGILNFKIAY